MNKQDKLTADRLRELLSYSPSSGEFTWLPRSRAEFSCERECNRWNNRYAGTVAGADDGRGYVRIRVCRTFYRAHRLAWLYVTSQWPSEFIDHVDGDRKNNRFSNLRDVNREVNAQNVRTAPVTNQSTGVLGVQRHVGGFYVAKLQIDGRQRHLGCFQTVDEAHAAYVKAKRLHHKGNTL